MDKTDKLPPKEMQRAPRK